ncbi:MAG TPA: glucosaminidase domain-containing protein [Saprospiraceae bacterium]|nr:glucosaminidase domain-containing protein [Saprospiraceae bacterium]
MSRKIEKVKGKKSLIIKRTNKYAFSAIVITLLSFYSFTPDNNNKLDMLANDYIENYSEIAIIEMYRTGVPASITLAQALHETNYGQSKLAIEANNHFGIKCKSYWSGESYYHKDDDFDKNGNLINSCFRKYNIVMFSYIDHSNFLREGKHYASLFEYDKTDFESWAYGLKRCGYATDPNYAEKLIAKIKKYDLYKYDYSSNPMAIGGGN